MNSHRRCEPSGDIVEQSVDPSRRVAGSARGAERNPRAGQSPRVPAGSLKVERQVGEALNYMKPASLVDSLRGRVRSAVDKVGWGIRVVGWPAAMIGALRLARLKLTRPSMAEVRLRESGATLAFAYPSQLVPALVVFGDLIDPEYPFLAAVAQPGWTFFDVGAAIGQFTVFAAFSVGGRVHAFEPSADNLATLRHNIERNGIGERVTIHQLALSNHSGEAEFATAANPFMSRLDASSSGTGNCVSVDTLTNVVAALGIEHVSVLKINVAGFEPAVIEGAVPLLAQGLVDVLILLIGRQSYASYRDLSALGYRFFFFHPGEQRLYEVASLDDHGLIRNRPWPARHVLAIRSDALSDVIGSSVTIARLHFPQGRTAAPPPLVSKVHPRVVPCSLDSQVLD